MPWYRIVTVVAFAGLAAIACRQDADELPEPKETRLEFACYPVEYLKPPQMPILSPCPLTHPELAGSYVMVMKVGTDGSVLSVLIPGEPSEAVNQCLRATVGRRRLEPARTCTGEALPAEYTLEYASVFGVGCLPFAPLSGASIAEGVTSGRTSGCS